MKILRQVFVIILVLILGLLSYYFFIKPSLEVSILKQIIARLEADTKIAQVLVTGVSHDAKLNKDFTTIKFIEFNKGRPLAPRYFTFPGDLIQFQSLVIRFNDKFIERGDLLKGKSAYLFWKVFYLNGKNTVEYEINKVNEVPQGYSLSFHQNAYEQYLWRKFWQYALDQRARTQEGIKNVQVEAPGTRFVPGVQYCLRIEHDGGIRIDSSPLP